jgi:hypothetical protein
MDRKKPDTIHQDNGRMTLKASWRSLGDCFFHHRSRVLRNVLKGSYLVHLRDLRFCFPILMQCSFTTLSMAQVDWPLLQRAQGPL